MSDDLDSRLVDDLPVRTASAAASSIGSDDTLLVSGFGSVGYPKAVPVALAESDRELTLSIVSGGSVGDEIDVHLAEADAIDRRYPYQGRTQLRDRINDGTVAFQDRNVSQFGDEVQYGGFCDTDVAVVEAVAVGPDWLIPTTSVGHTPAFVAAADRLVVEINESQPLELRELHDCYLSAPPPERESLSLSGAADRIGSPRISFDPEKLTAVVRTDRPDAPYTFREPTETDLTIASNFAEFLGEAVAESVVFKDVIHLQFGVGSLGNALMSSLESFDFGDRELAYFGEVIQDGLLEMIQSGSVRSASAASLALSEEGQQHLFSSIEDFTDAIVLRPADISNSPALIDRFGVIAVNSALEVDIYGHVNSTHLNGTHMMNGVGGSGDFTRNSLLGIIALPSTAKGGDLSRIVPMVPHVDHTEHDVDVVVTEQGVADLRGTDPSERADEIIENCAHPSYREDLQAYLDAGASDGGHVQHDLDTALTWNRS